MVIVLILGALIVLAVVVLLALMGREAGRAQDRTPSADARLAAEPRPNPSPPTPARATVRRDEYLSPEREAELVTTDAAGLPSIRLVSRGGRVVLLAPGGGMVNPRSRTLYRHGVFVFKMRGTAYYETALRAGDFSPRAAVRLVREPDNKHDPNAIAVYAAAGRARAGYVNKQMAARLARLIDAGTELQALSIDGPGARRDDFVPTILVARPEAIAHMLRAR